MKTEFYDCQICGCRMQKENSDRRRKFCKSCARINQTWNHFKNNYGRLNFKGQGNYTKQMAGLIVKHEADFWLADKK